MISFAALFLSVVLLQLSSGGVGPLDALSGLALGFTTAEVGLLGSAHFLGFFIGCWWAPRLMGTVGHSRAFAAFTATGAMGLLAHMMVVDPLAWAVMRVATGLCVAGSYTVIEAWLNARLTNETRGRAMGSYRIADMGAALAAQLLIGVLPPAAYLSYNLLALICIAALLPLTLSTLRPPETPTAPRLRPRLAITRSPLAAVGVVVAGLSGGAFRMIGPVYGQEVGLRTDQIALFLAAFVGGGALAQYPVGWLADRFDRRRVLIGLSVAAMATCGITVALSGAGTTAVFVSAVLFGAASYPVYSVSAAHAHDWAESHERVELSAALMFFFAVGATISPLLASGLIDRYGPDALFALIAASHAGLVIFGIARMWVRPAKGPRTRYVWTPRTSFIIGRLTKPSREADRSDSR
ncbi:MFS transporter [Rhodovulum adriaticum]|uniref:Putative MFS family arabinose efflux permease n=1 Tax=Rhodovulum adriaticum TaxID=35804 RepID=A0A4R2NIC9_RHOAD|nr:MFS transporter [Rhodovulum adriaticum]MBK1634631.1 hypothetical protein [Rhodovulum adriaticum]TCP21259.1 putative MFS family arabinose efflux permease [Rhodovulum adriaticum]